MPFSANTFDSLLIDQIKKLSPENILDIGAGAGKNGRLIKNNCEYKRLDAIEPTEEYIKNYSLGQIYDNVYQIDLQGYPKQYSSHRYDIVIFGDILEHLYRSEVIDYLDYFLYRSKWIIIIWPTNYEQDDAFNNYYEVHKNNFTLEDLNKFEVVFYLKMFGGYNNQSSEYRACDFHYAILKGNLAKKNEFIYQYMPNESYIR